MFGFGRKKDSEGLALLRAGKTNEAIAHYTKRSQEDSENPDSLIQLAKIYFRQKEYLKTKEWLLKAVKRELSEIDALQILDMTNYKKLASEKYLNSDPAFSPDGKWVAFSSARRDTQGDGRIRMDDRPGLYMVNIETGAEIQIVSDDFYNSHPVFSPDGTRVAFLSAREDRNHDSKIDHTDDAGLYLKDLASGKEECLIEAKHRPKFPSFSPDGNSLLFCSWYQQAKVCGIYLLNLRTKTVKTVLGLFESNFPVFSPNGDKIVYPSWRSDTNNDGTIDLRDNSALYEMNLKTGTESLLVSDRFSNSYPNFSPDGREIVYLSRRRDTNNDGAINSLDNSGIYLLDLAKKKEKELVSDEHYNKFPFFTYDGKQVVFLGSWRVGKKKAEEMDVDHSEYFENKGIHVVDRDGENEREIVSTKHYGCRFLCPSPKANLVAYISWRKDTNRGLYLAPVDRLPSKEEIKFYIENNL